MTSTASPHMKEFATVLMQNRPSADEGERTVEQMRMEMEAFMAEAPVPEAIEAERVSLSSSDVAISGCWYSPASPSSTVILYLHGGGYVMGSLTTHRNLMGRLAEATSARVLGIDYRLAPEHPFPAALSDAKAAYRWLIEQEGVSPENLFVAGDSAGGGLSLALLMSIRDSSNSPRPLPMAAGGILFSPWTDLTLSGESITTRAEQDPMITMTLLNRMTSCYCGKRSPEDSLISPLLGSYQSLPPLLVQVGEYEMLLDDSTRLASKAEAAKVPVDLQIFAQAFHIFQAFAPLPEAQVALEQVADFIQKQAD